MIDTSPEGLERLADEPFTLGETLTIAECPSLDRLRNALRALAAEKRAAQGGVMDAYRIVCESVVKHQFQDDHRRGRLTVDVETLLHEINARRAVLEAVWPSGKDAQDALCKQLADELRAMVALICAHNIESLSCDNDGERYCDCLSGKAKDAMKVLQAYDFAMRDFRP